MNEWRRSGWRNPAAWYTALGIALLAFSLWMPWLSASRTQRVEERADHTAECLLDAAQAFATPLDEPDRQALMARFLKLAQCRAVRVTNVTRIEPPPPGALLCLRNKHYAFQLTESPPDANERTGRLTVPSFEVVAWPLRQVGPGHCAFFYPDNAERAYTRNLRAGYAGLEQDRPLPGRSHRSPGSGTRRSIYASSDGERWILY